MVSLAALWLPILLSAVIVFVTSSVIHMMLGYHRADYGMLPAEDDVQAALRKFNLPPGDYTLPCPSTPAAMRSQEFIDKMKRGPRVMMTVMGGDPMSMTKPLVLWFVYSIAAGALTGYVAGIALPPGTEYRVVFRLVSTVAFIGYSLALWQLSIWYQRSWGTTIRSTIDGLIYALLTAGVFGWLWPAA